MTLTRDEEFGAAEQPDDFVTDVDDANKTNPRGVSR
jgi:hypothetical protein